jgi:DnaJ-class molecular chaperone
MGYFNKNKKLKKQTDATKPLSDSEMETDQEVGVQTENEETASEESEDRSAYNCPACKGEGLIFEGRHGTFCQQCHGTGKLN